MNQKKSSGRKAIESYMKHEEIVDNAVKLGKSKGLDVESTRGNDPNGDIKVAMEDGDVFLELLSKTIDKNQSKRSQEKCLRRTTI